LAKLSHNPITINPYKTTKNLTISLDEAGNISGKVAKMQLKLGINKTR
jgi:hypothetical protein